MGGSSSKGKIKKLKPKTLKELQSCVDVDFTVEEIEHWFKEYRESLSKGLDKLTEKEFRDVYNSVFSGDAKEFTRHLFRTFDTNGDGFVDFKEFIVGLCVSGSDKTDTRLRWAFRMYDYDGNGFITRDEMAAMLKAIYKMISTDVQEAENDVEKIDLLITDFFTKADNNNDNKISMEEFVGGVNSMPIILNLLQCDPEPEMLDENVVGKFDELEVKETNTKTESTKSGDESLPTWSAQLPLVRLHQRFFAFVIRLDNDNDNKISMEEFVGGVNSMPIILYLLQCDPEPKMLDRNVVGNFDELEVKETNTKTESTKNGDESRSKAYFS